MYIVTIFIDMAVQVDNGIYTNNRLVNNNVTFCSKLGSCALGGVKGDNVEYQ